MIPQQGLEEEAGLLSELAAGKQTRPGAVNTRQLVLQRLYPLFVIRIYKMARKSDTKDRSHAL